MDGELEGAVSRIGEWTGEIKMGAAFLDFFFLGFILRSPSRATFDALRLTGLS